MPESQGNLQGSGQAGQQIRKLIWLAFLFCIVVYALLPPLLRLPRQEADSQLQAVLFIALAIAAISSIAAIFVVRRAILSPRPPHEVADSPGFQRRTLLAAIVSWSLAEAVALFGVVLYLLFHKPMHLYPFLAVAFGLLLLLAPREQSGGGASLARPDVKIG
jgi:hypothetical protein